MPRRLRATRRITTGQLEKPPDGQVEVVPAGLGQTVANVNRPDRRFPPEGNAASENTLGKGDIVFVLEHVPEVPRFRPMVEEATAAPLFLYFYWRGRFKPSRLLRATVCVCGWFRVVSELESEEQGTKYPSL